MGVLNLQISRMGYGAKTQGFTFLIKGNALCATSIPAGKGGFN